MTRISNSWLSDHDDDRGSGIVPLAVAAAGLALLAVAVAPRLTRAKRERRRSRFVDDAPRYLSGGVGGRAVVAKTVLINRPKADLYGYWKAFENLPTFMENIRSVEVDGRHSTWTIAAPAGQTVTADVELVEDVPGERLAWRSTPRSEIETNGSVSFRDAPAGRGTYVEALVEYRPPAGALGRVIAQAFRREPQVQARHELKRFKMLMEAGEVATSARIPEKA